MQTANMTMQLERNSHQDLRWHVGSLIRILDTAEFRNEMVGIELMVSRGLEPPPHLHLREDEAVYVLRGDVEFTIGETTTRPASGEWVYMPNGVTHSYRILSSDAHLLTMYTPGGIEGFYQVISEPVEGDSIPAGTLTYDNLFDMEYIGELGREFGLKFFPARPQRRAAAA